MNLQHIVPNFYRLLPACAVALVLMCCAASSAFAQPCTADSNDCKGARVWNCTDIDFHVCFRLCCDGEIDATSPYPAPPTACPNGNPSLQLWFPTGCTLLDVAALIVLPAPPANVEIIRMGCNFNIKYK